MRAIWTGSVSFGLVNIPVKAYGATEDHDIDLHQVHDADGGRIRYERRCEVCGKKVDFENIDKAYDDGEQTVVITEEEMDSLPAEKSREIEVVQFVPSGQIDPITLERSYYLEPDSKSLKAYTLMRRTLEETNLTAVAKFALRQKTRLAVLRVRDEVLTLQTMMWGDEVREADFPAAKKASKITPQELKMSASLVEQFSGDFDPEAFHDDYQDELRTLIEEKLKTGEALDTEATFGTDNSSGTTGKDGPGNVTDLMEALKRSIALKRDSREPDKHPRPKSESGGAKKGTGAERKTRTAKPESTAKKASRKGA